jgi:hypothetical protein
MSEQSVSALMSQMDNVIPSNVSQKITSINNAAQGFEGVGQSLGRGYKTDPPADLPE